MDLVINKHEAQRLLDYLTTCPFKDVQQLVQMLVSLKPVPPAAPAKPEAPPPA